RLRRRGADGSDRARGSASAASGGGCGIRPRPSTGGAGDHPQPGVQPSLSRTGTGRTPAPRPPVRVDPGGVRRLGPTGGEPVRLPAGITGSRRTRPGGRRPHSTSGVHPRRSRRMIEIPQLALVALVGVSGSGKSTFAARHFRPTQVLSSDTFRAMVADDENDQSATADAFDLLYQVAAARLRRGRLTVVDATNVQPHARAALLKVAKA